MTDTIFLVLCDNVLIIPEYYSCFISCQGTSNLQYSQGYAVINHCDRHITPLIIIDYYLYYCTLSVNIIPSIKWPRVIGSNTLNEKRSLKLCRTQWQIYIDHLTEWYVYHSDLTQKICGCDHMMVAMPMVWIPLMVRCTLYNIMWLSLSVICGRLVVFSTGVLWFPPPIKLTSTI